jgi:hypothetical protein
MLTLRDPDGPITRRGFLTVGTLGLGGLSLSSLLAASEQKSAHVTGKSIVFLFQQGGPSQFETFDPKPDAPSGVRTIGGIIKTALPGVYFHETLPKLASMADRFTIVRSFQTNNADHNIVPVVSADSGNATLGALYSRVVGAIRSETGMPTNAVLFPQSVCSDVTKGAARGNISSTGGLGQSYAPFIPGAGGQQQKNMELTVPRQRLEDRRQLLAAFDRLNRSIETTDRAPSLDRFHDPAVQLLLSRKVSEALDLTREPTKIVERYDTSRFVPDHGWKKARRGARGYYSGHAKSLGKLMLMARRLCEAGCGFITIHASYEGIWDLHADVENLNTVDGMEAVARPFDHAVAAFIEDIEARGLSDKILLVCCGEMGRTPRINKNGGRDHWGRLSPLMVYGGGTRGGRVIGQSTKDGGEPIGDHCNPKHLISTMLHTAFDVGRLRLMPNLSAVAKLGEHETIPGLI